MTLESNIQELTDKLIEDLNKLRICREVFNTEIERREARILQSLSDARNLRLEHTDYNPRHDTSEPPHSSSSSNSDPNLSLPVGLLEVTIEPVLGTEGTERHQTIDSPRDLIIGDRVRITNRLSHAGRSPTVAESLATVVKINRVFVILRTDSGLRTKRVVSNLQLLPREA